MSHIVGQKEWEKSVVWAGVIAACLIQEHNKYLLVQEKQKKAYGLWNFPAGHVDKDETLEEAAIREASEETGYRVRLVREVGLYHEAAERPVKHVFMAEIIEGELTIPEDEILDARWFSYSEIEVLHNSGQLRAPFIWDAIRNVQALQ